MSQQLGGIIGLGPRSAHSSSPTLTYDQHSERPDDRPRGGSTNETSPTVVGGATMDESTTSDLLIAVMGPIGVGKSTFINIASGTRQATTGHSLTPCTRDVEQISYIDESRGVRIVLIDTPGFHDTNLTDLEILCRVAEWIKETHGQGILLSGILLFHRISDDRMVGSPLGAMKMFQDLYGKDALSNVMLVTTMWDEIGLELGQQHEEQLRDYWQPMLAQGARISRFLHTERSAHAIISHFQGCRRSLFIQDQKKGKAWYELPTSKTPFSPLVKLVQRIPGPIDWFDRLIRKEKDPVKRANLSMRKELREPRTSPARGYNSPADQVEEITRLHRQIPVETLQDAVIQTLPSMGSTHLHPSDDSSVPTGLITNALAESAEGQPSVDKVQHLVEQFRTVLTKKLDQLHLTLSKRRPRQPATHEPYPVPPYPTEATGIPQAPLSSNGDDSLDVFRRMEIKTDQLEALLQDIQSTALPNTNILGGAFYDIQGNLLQPQPKRRHSSGDFFDVKTPSVSRAQPSSETTRQKASSSQGVLIDTVPPYPAETTDIPQAPPSSGSDYFLDVVWEKINQLEALLQDIQSAVLPNTNVFGGAFFDIQGDYLQLQPKRRHSSGDFFDVQGNLLQLQPKRRHSSGDFFNVKTPSVSRAQPSSETTRQKASRFERNLIDTVPPYPTETTDGLKTPPSSDGDDSLGVFQRMEMQIGQLVTLLQDIQSTALPNTNVLGGASFDIQGDYLQLQPKRRHSSGDFFDSDVKTPSVLWAQPSSEAPRQKASSSQKYLIGSGPSLDTPAPGTSDGKILEDFGRAITCWIAAERALQHVRRNVFQVAGLFSRKQFREFDYAVLAGFDETLIRAGVGYLEQIHVFVSAEVDATSSLLQELGKIFSPFSAILFTPSSSFHIPVFKDGGSPWEFDELIHFTASKFADGGSSATMPPTVIGLSKQCNLADSPSAFSQQNSGNRDGEGKGKLSSKKGKARACRDDDEGDNENENDNDPKQDPPPGGWDTNQNAGPPQITFCTDSEIYLIPDDPNVFQSLTLNGSLTVETTPLDSHRRDGFSTCHVRFNDLRFGTTNGGIGVAYKQVHIKITADPRQRNARIVAFEPKRTLAFEREEKGLSSTKRGTARGLTGSITIGLKPQGTVAGSSISTNEESTTSEKKRYTSRITQQDKCGVVWWGFNVDDPYEQEGGMDMTDRAVLPTVKFEFLGDSGVPTPPPEQMDIELSSTWSIIPSSGGNEREKNWWPPKWLKRSKPSDNTHTPSYSNLCQLLALEMIPSKLPIRSSYSATLQVKPGSIDSPEVEVEVALKTDRAVKATPAMRAQQDHSQACLSDNPQTLSTLKFPTLTKLKLSDNHVQFLENSSSSSKTY